SAVATSCATSPSPNQLSWSHGSQLESGKVGTARAGVHPGSRSQREHLSGAKHYSRVIAYPRASLHAGTVQRAPEEEAMQIIETQELDDLHRFLLWRTLDRSGLQGCTREPPNVRQRRERCRRSKPQSPW